MQRLQQRSISPSETVLEGSPTPPSSPPALISQRSLPYIQCPFTTTQDVASVSSAVPGPCRYGDNWEQGEISQRQQRRRNREVDNHVGGRDGGEDGTECRKKKSIKTAKMPDTMEFHFDWWIGRLGSTATHVDLQALCASLMLWREASDIPRCSVIRTRNAHPQVPLASDVQHTSVVSKEVKETGSLSNGVNENGSVVGAPVSAMDWGMLLRQMRRAGEDMHRRRKWKMRGLKHAAGWCRWSKKQAASSQGQYVEDRDGGYRLHRKIEDETDSQEWTMYLGYRRETVNADCEGSFEIDDDRNGTDEAAMHAVGAAEAGGAARKEDMGLRVISDGTTYIPSNMPRVTRQGTRP